MADTVSANEGFAKKRDRYSNKAMLNKKNSLTGAVMINPVGHPDQKISVLVLNDFPHQPALVKRVDS